MGDLLESFEKKHDFLVCVDSDGCLLDNMELKHKECFCPATVNCWNLQSVSRYAREAAEFVNLYSIYRGTNRFPAVVRTLELLAERKEVRERGFTAPDLTPLKEWIENTEILSADALLKYVSEGEGVPEILLQAVEWSREVDDNIRRIVRNIRPFPGVREALERFRGFADVVVVSATPHEALIRELTACGIAPFATVIAGQEFGTKADCIHRAMKDRYDEDHVLKIGDAPGDYQAAQKNGVLFYPVIPSREEDSWKKLASEGIDRYVSLSFRGEYMEGRTDEFLKVLKKKPQW